MNEAAAAYTRHVRATYPQLPDPTENPPAPGPVKVSRQLSGTARGILDALHFVRHYAGHLRLAEFSPRVFKTVREGMVKDGNSRRTVNSRCVKVRQFLRWCVEEELVAPAVLESVRVARFG